MGGTNMEEKRGACFAGSSPPFLGRERAAVDVDFGPESCSPSKHRNSYILLPGKVYGILFGALMLLAFTAVWLGQRKISELTHLLTELRRTTAGGKGIKANSGGLSVQQEVRTKGTRPARIPEVDRAMVAGTWIVRE